MNKWLALLLLPALAYGDSITSTRNTTYDWACADADFNVLSAHVRQDKAFEACANRALADGNTYQVVSGSYRIEATIDAPDPTPDPDPDPACFAGCLPFNGDGYECEPTNQQTAACSVGYTETQGAQGWWLYSPASGPDPDPIPDPTPDPDPIPGGDPTAFRGIPHPKDTLGYDSYATFAVDVNGSGCNFSGTGTASNPHVIDLGGGTFNCGDNGASVSGQYVVLQNGTFRVTSDKGIEGESCTFCTVRDVNVFGTQSGAEFGSLMNFGNNAVMLRTEVAYFGQHTGAGPENDLHGMKACGSNKWILESNWHHLGGDSVQVGDASRCTGTNIFIGGNTFHNNRENCVDVKNSTNVVTSTNTCYLPNNKPDEAGFVFHDDPIDSKTYDNTIYDVNYGMEISGQVRNVVNGNNITARINGITVRSVQNVNITENTINAPSCVVNQGGVSGTVQTGCN